MTDIGAESAVVHFSGGSDSTFAAATMAERCRRVHLITYDRMTFIGVRDYTEKNYRRLVRVYGEDKFVRKIIRVDDLHRRICYADYFTHLRRHGIAVASLSFSKLAMFWASARYALDNGIRYVADGSVPYMALYPDQNPRVRERLRDFFSEFGLVYETPAFDRAADVEDLLYAKGITTAARVRGTDQDLQIFYLEQVLLALYLKFHLTAFGRDDYQAAIERLYDDKLRWIASQVKETV